MSTNIQTIIDNLSKLTVKEVAELSKKLEELWGVSSAPVMVAAAASTASVAVEEKTEFTVKLESAGEKKVDAIKLVRAVVPGLGLVEAKTLVESAPCVLKEGISKEDAAKIKADFDAIGAKITIL